MSEMFDLRKTITEALADAERVGMDGRTIDEWVAIRILASGWRPACAIDTTPHGTHCAPTGRTGGEGR